MRTTTFFTKYMPEVDDLKQIVPAVPDWYIMTFKFVTSHKKEYRVDCTLGEFLDLLSDIEPSWVLVNVYPSVMCSTRPLPPIKFTDDASNAHVLTWPVEVDKAFGTVVLDDNEKYGRFVHDTLKNDEVNEKKLYSLIENVEDHAVCLISFNGGYIYHSLKWTEGDDILRVDTKNGKRNIYYFK